MPRRDDLDTILILGSGPIVIGQACEFDYSGTQSVRALKEEGYRVVLVNSNPATIMTDPDIADQTYIEPITAEWVEKVIEKEKPDALLPTMGGQTALNVAMDLHRAGVLEKHGVDPEFMMSIAPELCSGLLHHDGSWGEVVATAERLAGQSGISNHAFKEACRIMGQRGAAARVRRRALCPRHRAFPLHLDYLCADHAGDVLCPTRRGV